MRLVYHLLTAHASVASAGLAARIEHQLQLAPSNISSASARDWMASTRDLTYCVGRVTEMQTYVCQARE
jgi:hypothetical protein